MKEGYKKYYTCVCIDYLGELIVINTHCYVSRINMMSELINEWNKTGKSTRHFYISSDNKRANANSKLIRDISELEYIH